MNNSKNWNKWENDKYNWMNEDQRECYDMLCELFCGAHHVFGIIRDAGPKGIFINTSSNLRFATFDFDQLTQAVILAHDRMIRFEISPSGPNMLKLFFHKRHQRDGRMYEKHPTIEEAIALHRREVK